ncbi:MAG: ribonuclease H family protein, partial [Nitrospirota bacterium]
RRGRQEGIYTSWVDCKTQVHGYPGAQYKAFSTKEGAEAYLAGPDHSQAQPSPQIGTPESFSDTHSPVQVWVDGACVPEADGTLHIGWAFLVYVNGQELHRNSGSDVPHDAYRHRNVAGEIMAIRKAVAWCQRKDIKEISIHYDYQGLESWVTGDWKGKTSFTQDYAQIVRSSGLTIHWVKVKAHSGELGNEIVDKLAREAAIKRKARRKKGNE